MIRLISFTLLSLSLFFIPGILGGDDQETPLDPFQEGMKHLLDSLGISLSPEGDPGVLTHGIDWPIKTGDNWNGPARVTGTFGAYRRPGSARSRFTYPHFHTGVDMGYPADRRVYSVENDTILVIGSSSIKTKRNFRYEHITPKGVRPRRPIKKHQQIGTINTDHLHFESFGTNPLMPGFELYFNSLYPRFFLRGAPWFDRDWPQVNKIYFLPMGQDTTVRKNKNGLPIVQGRVKIVAKAMDVITNADRNAPNPSNGESVPAHMRYLIRDSSGNLVQSKVSFSFDLLLPPYTSLNNHINRVYQARFRDGRQRKEINPDNSDYYFRSTYHRGDPIDYWNTKRIRDGRYRVTVLDYDLAGNGGDEERARGADTTWVVVDNFRPYVVSSKFLGEDFPKFRWICEYIDPPGKYECGLGWKLGVGCIDPDNPPDTILELRFSEPVDTASLRNALVISPNIPDWLWSGDTLLTVHPTGGLLDGTDYRITLEPTKVLDIAGTAWAPFKKRPPIKGSFRTRPRALPPEPENVRTLVRALIWDEKYGGVGVFASFEVRCDRPSGWKRSDMVVQLGDKIEHCPEICRSQCRYHCFRLGRPPWWWVNEYCGGSERCFKSPCDWLMRIGKSEIGSSGLRYSFAKFICTVKTRGQAESLIQRWTGDVNRFFEKIGYQYRLGSIRCDSKMGGLTEWFDLQWTYPASVLNEGDKPIFLNPPLSEVFGDSLSIDSNLKEILERILSIGESFPDPRIAISEGDGFHYLLDPDLSRLFQFNNEGDLIGEADLLLGIEAAVESGSFVDLMPTPLDRALEESSNTSPQRQYLDSLDSPSGILVIWEGQYLQINPGVVMTLGGFSETPDREEDEDFRNNSLEPLLPKTFFLAKWGRNF